MKTLIALLCLSMPVFAQDAGVVLLPDGTVCLDPNARKAAADRVLSCEAGYADLSASVKAAPSPVVPLVVVGVLALGAGVALGFGLSRLPAK